MSLRKRPRQTTSTSANNEFTFNSSENSNEAKKRKVTTNASTSRSTNASTSRSKQITPLDEPRPSRAFEDEEQWADYELVASREHLSIERAKTIIHLFKEDNTVPFLCRYRRNLIGWDTTPERLQSIKSTYKEVSEIKAKAQYVIKTLEKKGQLTKEVKDEILRAKSLDTISHLYDPFKERKTTLYQKAIDLGLLAPAERFLNQKAPMSELKQCVNVKVKGLESLASVLEGVKNIISYKISRNVDVVQEMEKLEKQYKFMIVTKQNTRKSDQSLNNQDQSTKFENYFKFKCFVRSLKPHQTFAINRGENLKILTVQITAPDNFKRDLFSFIREIYIESGCPDRSHSELFDSALEDAYSKKLLPLITRQIRNRLTKAADDAGIKSFATNLKQLLLTAPVRGEIILGIDPGFAKGCKVAVVSETGKLLDSTVLFPHTKQTKVNDSAEKLVKLMKEYNCTLIALGNGTACRETEDWITKLIKIKAMPKGTRYSIVSEQGASIYSCSPVARKEFGNLDVNLISACSIARRLMDPLAEMVKVDPKNLGVGMYQHDINAKSLQESLDEVVSECVSFVGVDINTASLELLKHIAGLSDKRAENIIKYRDENGPFKSRKQILKVAQIGPKVFTQCAGFIRIEPKTAGITGKYNILDSTTVHPEDYVLAEKIIHDVGCNLTDVGTPDLINRIKNYRARNKPDALVEKYDETIEIIETVFDCLQKKLFADYRLEVDNKPLFRNSLKKINDLKEDEKLTGKVMNHTDFGAFVDIGVGKCGLIHMSKMNGVKLKVGDVVEVEVLKVDEAAGRIGLSLLQVL